MSASAEENAVEAQARRVSEALNIADGAAKQTISEGRNTMKRNKRGTHRRRLSLENADGSFRERRSSLIAESVQEQISSAPADEQLGKLMTALLAEQAKIKPLLAQDLVYVSPEDAAAELADAASKAAAAVDGSAGVPANQTGSLDPEMASWGLSAMNEFCAGNVENRKTVADGGGQSIILDVMAFFFNDVYCQWQGCYSLASLAADRAHAATFGTAGIDAVLQCIGRTDLSELAAAGCRALSALCHFDTPPEEGGPLTELILHAKANGVADEMAAMLSAFPKDFQFQFRGQSLLQKFQKFEAPAAAAAAATAAAATDALGAAGATAAAGAVGAADAAGATDAAAGAAAASEGAEAAEAPSAAPAAAAAAAAPPAAATATAAE